MKIKAIRMFDGGFMTQAFAFGGERKKTGEHNPVMEGLDNGDEQIIYRASLQNFLIDTGEEVILVDTGFKSGFSSPAKMLGTPLFMGEKVADYMDSFAALGYKPEQVTRILVTHKHPDHTAALEYFPNAKVYISPEEADAMKLEGERSAEGRLQGKNIIRVAYTDKYKNFPHAVQIIPSLWFIEAKGHTHGNSIVVLEHDGLYYMFQGDVTYTDAALKANKLSIVFEDIKAARETLDRVRAFVRKNPTVYLSTHCPEGYENLELKRVMRL